jgi:nitroreductase
MTEEPLSIDELLRTTATCRYYRTEPVADELLVRVLDAARFAPQGGNRQPVRFIVVTDQQKKETLRDWYLTPWRAYMANFEAGIVKVEGEKARQSVLDADHMARHMAEVPILIVVCAVLDALHATDTQLNRVGIVAGASVYPAVQNLLLAAHAEGLGAAITTLLCADELRIQELLGIPSDVAVAAVLTLGHPERPLPRRLSRRPLSEIAYGESWGHPFGAIERLTSKRGPNPVSGSPD